MVIIAIFSAVFSVTLSFALGTMLHAKDGVTILMLLFVLALILYVAKITLDLAKNISQHSLLNPYAGPDYLRILSFGIPAIIAFSAVGFFYGLTSFLGVIQIGIAVVAAIVTIFAAVVAKRDKGS
jgi:hypothetical protein